MPSRTRCPIETTTEKEKNPEENPSVSSTWINCIFYKMQSQIQCPVCTLYLHVGMNLQVHLETHPKDQVIAALVNLTLLQQNTNENDEEVTQFRCSTYSPLTQENVPQQPQTQADNLPKQRAIEYHPIPEAETPATAPTTTASSHISTVMGSAATAPITTPKNTQLMILNSCSTRVIRQDIAPLQTISSSQIFNNSIPVQKSVASATTVATSAPITFTAQQLLPPPPPYDINNSAYKRIIHSQSELPKSSQSNYDESSTHNFFLFSNSIRNISDIRDIRSGNDTLQSSSRTSVTKDIPETSQNHLPTEIIEIENNIEDNYEEINEYETDEKYTETIVDVDEVDPSDDVIMIDDDEPLYNGSELSISNATLLSGVIHSNNLRQQTEPSTSNLIPPALPNKKRSRTKLRILSDVKLDASNAIPITPTIFRNTSFSGAIIDVDSYKPKFDKIQFSSLNPLPLTKCETDLILSTPNNIEVEDLTTDEAANVAPEDEKPNTNEICESRRILFSTNADVPECDEVMQSQHELIKNEFAVKIVYKEEIEMTESAQDDEETVVVEQRECSRNETYNVRQPDVPQQSAVHVPVISVQTSVIRMASLHIAETRPKSPAIICDNQNPETMPHLPVHKADIIELPPPPPYAEAVSHSKAVASVTLEFNDAKTSKIPATTMQLSSLESSSSSRTLLKKPFIKAPKKLVVKFKKPFVPIIEEEANLQPPIDVNVRVTIASSEMKIEPTDLIPMESDEPIVDTNHFDNDQTAPRQAFDCLENVPFSPLRESYTPTICYSSPVRDEAAANQQPHKTNSMELSSNVEFEYIPLVLELKNEPGVQTSAELADNLMTGDVDEKQEDHHDLVPTDDTLAEQKTSIVFTETNSGNASNETSCAEPPFAAENEIAMPLPMAPIVDMKSETWLQPSTSSTTLATLLNIDTKKEIEVTNITTASEIYTILTANQNCHQPPATSTSNMQNSYIDAAGPSRLEYGLSTFLGYNDPAEGEDFYSGVPLSPIGFSPDSYAWNQRFSPPFAPFDNNERNSYMDLDLCKNSNCDRAPSADSLNIRTDEKMPAKGEISEQESNGDIDGSWSHQVSLNNFYMTIYCWVIKICAKIIYVYVCTLPAG